MSFYKQIKRTVAPLAISMGTCLAASLCLCGLALRSDAQDYTPTPTTHKFPYVGADLACLDRLESVPGRKFLDFNGKPVDPLKFFAANGFNAVRVGGFSCVQPLKTSTIDNRNVDSRELNFQLDWGGVDRQVATARQGRQAGQKVILTIQLGQDLGPDTWHEYIPKDMLGLSYTQTLAHIDKNTRQIIDQFLDARVQPDVITVENEADSGMLFQFVDANGKMAIRDNPKTDVFSNVATGIYTILPKYAGYFKQEIISAKSEIQKRGFDPSKTRFALHTTTNAGRARFVFDRVFNNPHPDAESVYYNPQGQRIGVVTAVPAYLRKIRLRDLVDIMGFSYYPGLPKGGTKADFDDALAGKNGSMDLTDDLAYFNTSIPRYGTYANGPFKGQYRKQALIVEYGTATSKDFDVTRQDRFTVEFFNTLAQYPWVMGAMWWEPEYAHNNWSGRTGSLYREGQYDTALQDVPALSPVDTVKIWGSFAERHSPMK